MATYMAGTLKVSNMICVIFSLHGKAVSEHADRGSQSGDKDPHNVSDNDPNNDSNNAQHAV